MTRFAFALTLTLTLLLGPAARAASPVHGAEAFPQKNRARIVIVQDEQQMRIYEGDDLVRSFPISTGWPGKRQTWSPPWQGAIGEYWGTFSSFGSTQDHGYWLFTDYIDDSIWNGDILIHGAPYQLGPNGEKQYDLTGIGTAPSSHGCIRMLPQDIEWFQAWDPRGVPVEIRPFTDPARFALKLVVGVDLIGEVVGAVER